MLSRSICVFIVMITFLGFVDRVAVANDAPAETSEIKLSNWDVESLGARLQRVEAELAELQRQAGATQEGHDDLSGWQLQVRGEWFHQAHQHNGIGVVNGAAVLGNDAILANDAEDDGWGLGVALEMPLWDGLGPIDLRGYLSITYRQVKNGKFRSAIATTLVGGAVTARNGTVSYLNIIAGPQIRIPVTEMIRPFVFVGMNMQVISPTSDAITYLDIGATVGAGVDLRLHRRLSVGLDYRYSWFGTADQEEEDYGAMGIYLGFNF